MAQQGSLYAENSSWFVRYWEIVRQPDGSLKRKHPAHRLASVRDYPRKSEVIRLKNRFMEKLSKIRFRIVQVNEDYAQRDLYRSKKPGLV